MGCNHEWVYNDKILCSNPPKQEKICKKCGSIETNITGSYEPNEFNDLIIKFNS